MPMQLTNDNAGEIMLDVLITLFIALNHVSWFLPPPPFHRFHILLTHHTFHLSKQQQQQQEKQQQQQEQKDSLLQKREQKDFLFLIALLFLYRSLYLKARMIESDI